MGKNSKRRKLRSAVVSALAAVALELIYYHCQGSCGQFIQDYSLIFVIGLGLFSLYQFGCFFAENISPEAAELSEFVSDPAEFHRRVVRIRGRVEFLIDENFRERIKRFFIDQYRTLRKISDKKGRYIHQRFLISSPALPDDENILVLHNVKFGRLDIKPGRWLEVQGEYLHSRATLRGALPRKSKFGRIHFTHEPIGHIHLYPKRPRVGTCTKVVTISS